VPALLLLPFLLHCTSPAKDGSVPPPPVSQVLERHTGRLMSLRGVVGTAEGSCGGAPCILVLVDRLTPELRKKLPKEIEGIRVEVRETGPIRAQ
jgi:hypothetical protein